MKEQEPMKKTLKKERTRICHFFDCPSCSSTNRLAKRLIQEGVYNEPFSEEDSPMCFLNYSPLSPSSADSDYSFSLPLRGVVASRVQTQGYGTNGRQWVSNKGGVYLSIVLHLDQETSRHIGLLSLAVGVSVARVLKNLGIPAVTVKWPNDVKVQGKKISGILIEREEDFAVVGIGLNVNNVFRGSEGVVAVCLADFIVQPSDLPSFKSLVSQILVQMELCLSHSFIEKELKKEWKALCPDFQQIVTRSGITGVFSDLGPEGEMILTNQDGNHVIRSFCQD